MEGENARRVEPRVSAAEVMFVVVVAGAAVLEEHTDAVKGQSPSEKWSVGSRGFSLIYNISRSYTY